VTAAVRWHGVEVGEQDLQEVRTLFAQVFGTEMAPRLWHWKYGDGAACHGTRSDTEAVGPLRRHGAHAADGGRPWTVCRWEM
jgi:hypothetical protein